MTDWDVFASSLAGLLLVSLLNPDLWLDDDNMTDVGWHDDNITQDKQSPVMLAMQ